MEITDYNVRVWCKDVMIHSKNVNYWGGRSNIGLQTNDEEGSERFNEILELCESISKKFLKLNELLEDEGREEPDDIQV